MIEREYELRQFNGGASDRRLTLRTLSPDGELWCSVHNYDGSQTEFMHLEEAVTYLHTERLKVDMWVTDGFRKDEIGTNSGAFIQGQGLAYAWGRKDGGPDDITDSSEMLAFARAWAECNRNNASRPNIQHAYDTYRDHGEIRNHAGQRLGKNGGRTMREQSELFSRVANQKLYISVRAFSDRKGVSVHIGSESYDYGRPGRNDGIDNHVFVAVTDAVKRFSGGRYDASKGWEIQRSRPKLRRGEHHFSVWMPK